MEINASKEFFNQIENGIFINLSDLQQNVSKFFYCLNSFYGVKIPKTIQTVLRHTKSRQLVQNRTYTDIELPLELLKTQKNEKIETFIENLKTNYKKRRTPNGLCVTVCTSMSPIFGRWSPFILTIFFKLVVCQLCFDQ